MPNPSTKPLRVWTNAKLPDIVLDTLRAGVEPHQLIVGHAKAPTLGSGDGDPDCRSAHIAFGQPSVDDILASQTLRWIQLTSAGYTKFDRDDLRAALKQRNAVMTNSSSVYNEPCANHLLAMIVSTARRIPHAAMEQTHRHWHHEGERLRQRLLTGDSVVIMGFGAIAHRLVELLAPLRMDITAVRRTPSGNEPVRTVPTKEVDQWLAKADHVVNILPASNETKHFFDAARIDRIKPGAYFYNIGRGDTVDQTALLRALQEGQLSGAYLDVTTPEPLPPDDPLWSAPNCFITAHIAGGHNSEFDRVARHFLDNFERFNSGEELQDVIFPKYLK